MRLTHRSSLSQHTGLRAQNCKGHVGAAKRVHAQQRRQVTARADATSSAAASVEFKGLASDEQEALKQYLSSQPKDKAGTLEVIRQGLATKSVPPPVMEGAVLNLEQLSAADNTERSVDGAWLLVFGTATKIQQLRYIPIREFFVINTKAGKVSLDSNLGPLSFSVRGMSTSYDPTTGALGFQWKEVVIGLHSNGQLGNKELWRIQYNSSKPKTYTFFYADEQVAAARSSAGGVAALMKAKTKK